MGSEFPDFPIVGHREQDDFSVALNDENPAVLADIRPQGRTWLKLQILNGVTALDEFKISTRSTKGANFIVEYESSSDYTTLAGRLQGTSGDLTILGVSAEGWLWIFLKGVETIRFEVARAVGGNSVVTARAGTD